MKCLAVVAFAVLVLAGCGDEDGGDSTGAASTPSVATAPAAPPTATNPTPRPRSGDVVVAALGDSITAGSPLYDPNPDTRREIGEGLDPKSQFEYWYTQTHPRYRFRNCGVFGERTDEIADRLEACAQGATVLVVQGGINDIAQGRRVEDAAQNLREMYEAGKALGLKVATVEVLPWNNGYPDAAPEITKLNALIHRAAKVEGVPVSPWYAALEDPGASGRMQTDLTIDGNHPSVAGYKLLASKLVLP